MENCKHGNTISSSVLENLHHNQGGSGRHRCPVCAFQLGFTIGLSKKCNSYSDFINSFEVNDLEYCPQAVSVPTYYLLITGDNQGGSGRHKCCNCAFKEGFEEGLNIVSQISDKNNNSSKVLMNVNPPNIENSTNSFNNSLIIKNFDFESNNEFRKLIGDFGESLVVEYERNLLYNNVRKDSILNVAKDIGDGLGYDVLSFDENGNEKYIEVKTTSSDFKTPFYITLNEKNFLLNNENTFIYRLFNLSIKDNSADFYILNKDMVEQLNFIPQVYKVYV
ncbi:DUF3883 domain-containing protein [Empedobacter brevis]|uniref:DUF3883 domain-containing protein n=1 Tax=Empedobacter brevis TaxID=247 RepID=UPI002896818D|nr:DUF3883 domain-containing protein [Empedobacter brevis]